MAIAFLSTRERIAVVELLDLDITRSDLDDLFDKMLDLPHNTCRSYSCRLSRAVIIGRNK